MPTLRFRRCIVHLLVLAISLSAVQSALALTRITGTVPKAKGMTVVGLSRNGTAATAKLPASGRFVLRFAGASGRGATLHLIRANGTYFGPVVLRRVRRAGYAALRGTSVRLGRIRLAARHGRTVVPTPMRALVRNRTVRLDGKGRPVGSASMGLVKAPLSLRGLHGNRSLAAVPGGDEDQDGLPNSYDIDNDGDLVLDAVDPGSDVAALHPVLFAGLNARSLAETLNANAGAGVTEASVDALIRATLTLHFWFFEAELPGRTVNAVGIDCFQHPYCRAGDGTAEISTTFPSATDFPDRPELWRNYDPNGDGLPDLVKNATLPSGEKAYAITVFPHAGIDQIALGDTFNFLISTEQGLVTVPTSLASAFVTTPAIASYDDGSGVRTLSYPYSEGQPGTPNFHLPFASDKVTFTVWRPQREAVAGAEPEGLIDMGHLKYGFLLDLGVAGAPQHVFCSAADYSALSATLQQRVPAPPPGDVMFLLDRANDAAPDATRTLGFTFDIGGCLRRQAIDPRGRKLALALLASDHAVYPANVAQEIHVSLP